MDRPHRSRSPQRHSRTAQHQRHTSSGSRSATGGRNRSPAAAQRLHHQQQHQQLLASPGGASGGRSSAHSGASHSTSHHSTFQQQSYEDPEYQELVHRTKASRQETLDITRDALGRLRSTEASASSTLTKLGQQGEMLNKAEVNMQSSIATEREASQQITEIKRLNKLFSLPNPFRSKRKEKAKLEAKAAELAQKQSEERAQLSGNRYQSYLRTAGGAVSGATRRQDYLPGANRIDSDILDDEDRAQEQEIDEAFGEMSSALGNIKQMAINMNVELEAQNGSIQRLGKKSDDLNARLKVQDDRLKRIR